MIIYVALGAAGLVALSVVIRIVRCALAPVAVAVVVDFASGHGLMTASQLAQLLTTKPVAKTGTSEVLG